jgi:hypothetical protein
MSEPRAASAASLEPGQGQGPARDAVIGAAMEPNDNADQLTISPETVFYIIVKARAFDEKVAPSDPKRREGRSLRPEKTSRLLGDFPTACVFIRGIHPT